MLIDDDRLVQALDDAVRAERDFVVGLDVPEHDHEFVAAHADHHVGIAHAGAQPPRHLLQELVAGLVAARIVDVLEAVEVEEHDAQHGVGRPRLGDGLGQERGEIMAVGQPGQLIVVRHPIEPLLIVDELLLGLAAHRDVVRDVGKPFAAVRFQRVAAHFDVDRARRPCSAAADRARACESASLQAREQRLGCRARRRRKCRSASNRRASVVRIARCAPRKAGLQYWTSKLSRIDDDDAVVGLIDDRLVAGIDRAPMAKIAPLPPGSRRSRPQPPATQQRPRASWSRRAPPAKLVNRLPALCTSLKHPGRLALTRRAAGRSRPDPPIPPWRYRWAPAASSRATRARPPGQLARSNCRSGWPLSRPPSGRCSRASRAGDRRRVTSDPTGRRRRGSGRDRPRGDEAIVEHRRARRRRAAPRRRALPRRRDSVTAPDPGSARRAGRRRSRR